MQKVKESDWKKFRVLREAALERFCGRVLKQVSTLAARDERSNHAAYLEIYDFIHAENDLMADLFDGLSRSRMVLQLMGMRAAQLLTTEEVATFSDDLQEQTRPMT